MSQSLHFSPRVPVEVLYPKGSVIVCRACGLPLYRLQASICHGEPMAKSAWKYAPVSVDDVVTLMMRADLEPGVRAALKAMPSEDVVSHCARIPTLKAGDFADCPACKQGFAYAETRGADDGASSFGDRGYRVQLSTIPPQGQARPILTGAAS